MPLLNAKQLGDELGFTPKFIRRLAQTGKIPAFKFGSEWRFDLQAVRDCGKYKNNITQDARMAARASWIRRPRILLPRKGR